MTDTRTLLREAKSLGFEITFTRKSHWKLRAPSGALVIVSGTPSDRNSIHKARS